MGVDLKILDKKFYNAESNGMLLNPLPIYATEGGAGMDLLVTKDYKIYPGERVRISTGIAIWINDPNVAGIILPRFGLGTRGLVLANTIGLIDSDYQGELKINAWNSNEVSYLSIESIERPIIGGTIKLKEGDKIAQVIFVPVLRPNLNVVEDFSISTERE